MSDAAGDDGKARPDLGCLTESERATLDMLARGHTAKSIARLTGQTENVVNERLRSARRKSGVGSSRELARLLDRQKTWDRENRDEAPAPLPAGEQRPVRRRAGLATLGALIMSLALALAAAVLLQAGPPPLAPAPTGAHDPLLGGLVELEQPSLVKLHARVREEPRDAGWAAKTEAALRDAYGRLPAMADTARALRILCGSSLCEVAGPLTLKAGEIEQQYKSIQSSALGDAIKPLGLETASTAFGSEPDNPKQSVFVAYWTRGKD